MSAAAAAALPRRAAGREARSAAAPLPSWTNPESADFLRWLPLPADFVDHAMRKLTGLESQLLLYIHRWTVGDERAGRPEWLEVSMAKAAAHLGASRQGVSLCLDRLGRAGAIEARRVGRGYQYRITPERWASLIQLPPEPIPGDDPEAETEGTADPAPATTTGTRHAPMIVLGKHKVPLASVKVCKSCAEQLHAAVAAAAAEGGEKGEQVANDMSTQLTYRAPEAAGANSERKANDMSTQLTYRQDATTQNQQLKESAALVSDELFASLSNRFGKTRLGPPPPRLVEQAARDLTAAGVPLSDLIARIDQRKAAFTSYGLLPGLVKDVIEAAVRAAAVERRRQIQTPPDEQALSMTEQIRSHAAALISKYEQLPGAERAVELLGQINQNAARYAEHPTKLIEALGGAEIEAAEAAANCMIDAKEYRRIDSEAKASIRDRRSRLTLEQQEYEMALYRAPRILAACGLPRIAWVGGS